MFKQFESCFGLSFPAIGKWKIELWYAPSGYSIREHTHNQEDIKLIFLFGHNVKFHRRKWGAYLGDSFMAKFKHIGKVFTINAGDAHYFEVSDWPLIFMNIEKWKSKPTSASQDMQFTN